VSSTTDGDEESLANAATACTPPRLEEFAAPGQKADAVREGWEALELNQQRQLLRELGAVITVGPALRGLNRYDPGG
jgi:hypothetical protein